MCKTEVFFFSILEARARRKTAGYCCDLCGARAWPSVGIGVVEVQKLLTFVRFQLARATLCGDWRGRCAKAVDLFAFSCVRARPSAGIGVVEVQKLWTFCVLLIMKLSVY